MCRRHEIIKVLDCVLSAHAIMHHGARTRSAERTVAHGDEALRAQLRTDKKRSAHGLRTDGKRPAHPCARWRTLAHGGVLLRKVAHGGAQTVRTVAHPCARMRKHIFQLHVLYCCSVVLVISIGYLNTSVLPPPCQGQKGNSMKHPQAGRLTKS